MSRLSDRTKADLAKAERRRLIEAQGRERRTVERREVAEGVAESVMLAEARGAVFVKPKAGEGAKPVRRMTGVAWLVSQGKLTAGQFKAAMGYGEAYRAMLAEASLRSCLGDHTPGGDGPSLAAILAKAGRRMAAADRILWYACAVSNQRELLDALNVICGDELTPREAGGNAVGAAVYTTRLLIALDLIVAASATPTAEAA